jgi:hypothetical protein
MQNQEGQYTPEQTHQEPEPVTREPEQPVPSADETAVTKIQTEEESQRLPSQDEASESLIRPQQEQQEELRQRSRLVWQATGPASRLPRRGLQSAVITGIIAGVLTVLINVAITLLNIPLFQQALREGKNLTLNTAFPLLGVECLNFFVSLVICFFAGFVIGRIAVRRQLGFIAGMLTGVINYLGSFVVRYIPNYPGNMTSNAPGGIEALTGGIVVVIVFLLIWGMIGGLVGLWGTWTASRKHPYYQV